MPFLQTLDETSLYYVDWGSGPPVVLVASTWLNSRMWEFQLPFLAGHGLRCVAYDRRGHGRSDWPWNGYDYDTLADDLAALIEQLDLRGVALISHSAAGGEVIRYLTRHGPERVKRIALVSSTTPFLMKSGDNPDGVDPALVEADMAARAADRPLWFAQNAGAFFGIGLPGITVSPEFVELVIRQCLECSVRAAAEFFLTGFRADLRAELSRVSVPTLIIHGDRDVQAPIDLCGRRTARLVPDARLVEYQDAAHGLFVTHADRLNADLLRFIQG